MLPAVSLFSPSVVPPHCDGSCSFPLFLSLTPAGHNTATRSLSSAILLELYKGMRHVLFLFALLSTAALFAQVYCVVWRLCGGHRLCFC